jgi:hypothetical protein
MNFSCLPVSFPPDQKDTFNLFHSGISPMDLGLYDECLRNSSTSYFLTTITLNPPGPFSITNGFCLNKNCSAENVTFAVNALLNLANISAVGKATQITGNEGSDTINGSTVFVVFLMCSIAAMGLIYPLYNFFKSYLSLKDKSGYYQIMKENSDKEIALIENVISEKIEVGSLSQLKNGRSGNDAVMEFIKCFSITDNWKKLWDVREGPLDFLNGVKSFAFFFVILGHEFLIRGLIMPRNPNEAVEIMKSDYFEFLVAAFYAVDVFLWVGGFLVAFVLIDSEKIS